MNRIDKTPFYGCKLISVEDDKTIVEGLEYYLMQEGFQVTSCFDASSAMGALDNNAFDLAILDVYVGR